MQLRRVGLFDGSNVEQTDAASCRDRLGPSIENIPREARIRGFVIQYEEGRDFRGLHRHVFILDSVPYERKSFLGDELTELQRERTV